MVGEIENRPPAKPLSAALQARLARQLQEALALHRAGKLPEASALYVEITQRDPHNRDALHLRGLLAHQQGRHEEALLWVDRALALSPNEPIFHSTQGKALAALRQPDQALVSFQRAVNLNPKDLDAQVNLGLISQAMGQYVLARDSYKAALELKPGDAQVWFGLGVAMDHLHDRRAALESFERALILNPAYVEACVYRALMLVELNDLEGAVAAYDQALRINPSYAQAYSDRSGPLLRLGRLKEALDSCEQALRLNPDFAGAHLNRANALYEMGDFEAALQSSNRALSCQSHWAEALANRGVILHQLGRIDESMVSINQALAVNANQVDARLMRGILLLLQGDFEQAWDLYEARWQQPSHVLLQRNFNQPQWDGRESLKDRRILLHAEQGLGDTIQFIRYLQELVARGATVILEIPKALNGLLGDFPGVASLVFQGDDLPQFDVHCPLLSLPRAFATRLDTVPAAVPYLYARADLVASWRSKIGDHGFKVGISWQGSRHRVDLGRSFPVSLFEAISQIPGVRLISLQKNDGVEQLNTLPSGMHVETLGADFDAGGQAFLDSAAVIQNLDLVITSDTALAHLAGALAAPVWLVLKAIPDWRWLLQREDSPWYPTMRLFRQPSPGDWGAAFDAVYSSLSQLINAGAKRPDLKAISAPLRTPSRISLGEAVAAHQAGDLVSAKAGYLSLLGEEPKNADALHLVGLVELQNGQFLEALNWINQAISIMPSEAGFYCNRGKAYSGLGRTQEAIDDFRFATTIDPTHADSFLNLSIMQSMAGDQLGAMASVDEALRLQNLAESNWHRGNVLMALESYQEASQSYLAAIALRSNYSEAHCNLGTARRFLGMKRLALESYGRAIMLKPDFKEAYSGHGAVLYELGRFESAIASFDKAISLNDRDEKTYLNRAVALLSLHRYDLALEAFNHLIELSPNYAEAHAYRGAALEKLGDNEGAILSGLKAVELAPTLIEARINLGSVFQTVGRYRDALEQCDFALNISNSHVDAYVNRGNALTELGRYGEAMDSCRTAISLDANNALAHFSISNPQRELGLIDEALASCDKGLQLRPGYEDGVFNKSLITLLRGDLVTGFKLYESRFKKSDVVRMTRHFIPPQWDGVASLKGQSIFIASEQGLGDCIQFVRYLPLLAKQGARVIFEVSPRLRKLLAGIPGVDQWVLRGQTPPDFDCYCRLLSLPHAFGTSLDTIPAAVPYLHAEPDRIQTWRSIIGTHGFRIGIAWQGSVSRVDLGRSFPASQFKALMDIPGVRLISLQKNEGAEQLDALPAGLKIERLPPGFDEGDDGFVDSAAVIANLDLVITSDTALAHLAGALGAPTWVILRKIPDWRWLLDRTDSPWYPTVRLFRQKNREDWADVFHEVRTAVRSLVGAVRVEPSAGAMF